MVDLTAAQLATLVAIVAGVLIGIPALYLLIACLHFRYYRARCPACGHRGLKCVQWIRATIEVDGKRAPASWTYFRCESCGAKYKQHIGRELEIASEEEWARFCEKNTLC
jgi:hypothetical protein